LDRWIEMLERIDTTFKITDRTIEEFEDQPGEVETVFFRAPMGEMRLEREVRPLVLQKKMRYSKRMGAAPTAEYVYSDSETSDRVRLWKRKPSGEWEEVDFAAMFKGAS
jgi:hypothetical protein